MPFTENGLFSWAPLRLSLGGLLGVGRGDAGVTDGVGDADVAEGTGADVITDALGTGEDGVGGRTEHPARTTSPARAATSRALGYLTG